MRFVATVRSRDTAAQPVPERAASALYAAPAVLDRLTCGRDTRGLLPLSQDGPEQRLTIDWTRCAGHGLCAHLVPELVQLDGQGYPEFLDMPVPPWLSSQAAQAAETCPALALRLTPVSERKGCGAVFPTSDAGATKEHRRSEEGRQRLPAARERASQESTAIEGLVVTEA